MRQIGIMGGTFNPIHNGHLLIAEKAREQFALEKVLFMPSGIPYMKDQQEVLPVSVRCEMTALAIADHPFFELSTLEAADARQGKNTYTFETLQKLHHADPDAEYFFILGADSLYAIEHWKQPARIFEHCTLLVAVRADGTDLAGSQNRLLQQMQYLRDKYSASVEILKFEGIDVSSTQIREKVRCGESISGLVPEAVETYLRKQHFYEKRKEAFQ